MGITAPRIPTRGLTVTATPALLWGISAGRTPTTAARQSHATAATAPRSVSTTCVYRILVRPRPSAPANTSVGLWTMAVAEQLVVEVVLGVIRVMQTLINAYVLLRPLVIPVNSVVPRAMGVVGLSIVGLVVLGRHAAQISVFASPRPLVIPGNSAVPKAMGAVGP